MLSVTTGWELQVDRGPGWLLVRASCPEGEPPADASLTDQVWELLEKHFVYRLVLDLDQVRLLRSELLGQLVLLHRRVRAHGGLMRLCGISRHNQDVLEVHGLNDRFPVYYDLEEAVMGYLPKNPR